MISIIEPNDSLVNYYILPLLGYNKHSFGGDKYFINSYLSRDYELIVMVKPDCPIRYWEFEHFKTDFNKDGDLVLIFHIDGKFKQDLGKFISGNFSKMSTFAKDLIYKNSGLFYKKKLGDVIVTSKILLALTRSKALKSWLQEEYGIELSEEEEVIPKPSTEIFYNY